MPEISIIVPIYNVEAYLDQCLNSIEKQTFTDFEAILVNDGSTDSCRKIAFEYTRKDQRFKLIDQENMGLSCARNTGLKHAKGSYYIDDR